MIESALFFISFVLLAGEVKRKEHDDDLWFISGGMFLCLIFLSVATVLFFKNL
jgi:hypothetical protein